MLCNLGRGGGGGKVKFVGVAQTAVTQTAGMRELDEENGRNKESGEKENERPKRRNEEFRRKTSYVPKQKNPVFVGFCMQCTSPRRRDFYLSMAYNKVQFSTIKQYL